MSESIKNKIILKNSIWAVSEKALRFCLSIFVVGMVARYLGSELFGQLNFSLAVLSIATVVATVGVSRIVPREVVQSISDPIIRSEIVSTIFVLRLLVAFCILVLLFYFGFAYVEQRREYFFLVVICLVFNPFDVIDLHQQGMAQIKSISIIRSTSFVTVSLLRLLAVYLEVKPIWFFALITFEHMLAGFLLYIYIRLKNGNSFLSLKKFKKNRVISILKESWPEIIAGLSGILFMRLDQVMIQFMEGPHSVGVYSAAVRISEAWYFLPISIVLTTFPKIVQLRNSNDSRYIDAMHLLFSFLVGISAVVIIIFMVFANKIVEVVFGPQYSESATILQVHCMVAMFVFLGSASGSWLAAEKKLIWNLHRNLLGLVINVALNFILIDRYGALGAALATLFSVASAYYIYDIFSPKLRFMFWIKTHAIFSLGLYGVIRYRRHWQF